MIFLENPHLPNRRAGLCAIASGHAPVKSALEALGIAVLEVQPNQNLAAPVNRHADMQLHDMGRGEAAVESTNTQLIKDLEAYGFRVHKHKLREKYPENIGLNCFCIKKTLICMEKNTSDILLNYYQSKGVIISDVKQGYAKCSACMVDASSLITSDKTIAASAKAVGADVLMISSGHIKLDGYSYGFIGGCCGLVDKGKLAFCGRISEHPDYAAIKSFCEARGVGLIELCDTPLLDIGGIIPLAL